MEQDRLPDELAKRAPRLVASVRRAYADNHERFSWDIGNDTVTYGLSVARSVWFQIEREFLADEDVSTDRPNGSFEVYVAGIVVQSFKLGSAEHDNVWESRPSNADATERMAVINAAQTTLGLPGVQPTRYILGHFGNPELGFAKAYLCVPILDARGDVVRWESCTRIDRDEGRGTAAPPPAPAPITPPQLRVRRRPLASDEEAGAADTGDA